jgi:hypothetical protein
VKRAKRQTIGHFDGIDDSRATGWVADLSAPDRVLEVEFFRVGRGGELTPLGWARADRPRDDLRTIGLNEIHHGFEWRIGFTHSGFRLSARVVDDGFELPGSPVEVTPRLREEDDPHASTSGHLDGIDGSRAVGWVLDLNDPERVLEVEFFRVAPDGDSILLGRARANRLRQDLATIGLEQIHHGFEWRVPFPRSPFLLGARVADSGVELPGSPVDVTPRQVYEGSVDAVTRGVLRGWAWAWDPQIPVAVEVFIDGQYRGIAPARTERPDLLIAQLGDGQHGFAWIVPGEFADGMPHEYSCRIAASSVWLKGSPQIAVISPGDRSAGSRMVAASRGYANRPAAKISKRPNADIPAAKCDVYRRPPNVLARGAVNCCMSTPAKSCSVRLLVPVWGEEYISLFFRVVLPSFLSPNNLPYLVRIHSLEVVFLIRAGERDSFALHPAYQRLSALASINFIEIDDILSIYFDKSPNNYATALTYAFFRGIRSVGAAALDTDFVFWNADFVPADGLFRTLADLIAAGVHCTFVPSLRVDLAVEDALPAWWRSGDGGALTIGSGDWVALAMRFLHPTVKAQTANRFEERMIDTVNQLYWHVNDQLMVARVFLMFMLHLRPEVVWDQVYGHCDYVFVPEMVPSGDYHFETDSDRMLIIELQRHNREWQDIVYGDAAMSPSEVAAGAGRWTTREHRLASQNMVVFKAGEGGIDLEPIRRMTDDFMDEVYKRIPHDPIWHNGHFYWTDSLASLGLLYEDPGPDHPRSHLAAALHWTGYDIDVLRESWPDPAGPPHDIFGLTLPLDRNLDIGAWLAQAHERYCGAWRRGIDPSSTDLSEIDLISGRFHGFGWGLVERNVQGWARRLGPAGEATLLLRAPATARVSVRLDGADYSRSRFEALSISVNGRNTEAILAGFASRKPSLRFSIERNVVARAQGRLEILLTMSRRSENDAEEQRLAFTSLAVRID